jgi:hypothetical protein
MDNFKFERVANKFRWESNFMVLEFSKPSIQGFSDYINLTSEKEIMYYYYTINIFKKVVTGWDDKDNEIIKWKLASKRSTHDFPSITQLKWILEYQLKDNTIIDGQKHEYQSGDIRYSKTISTEGFGCDDFYEITKSIDSNGNKERYTVYCGTSFDLQGDLNSSGIRTPYVYRKDIEELLKCVSSFVQYSLDKHNKQNTICKDSYDLKNNKIYEYNSDNEIIDKNKIESIYAIGDIVSIKTVINNQEEDYGNVTIYNIENDNICLNNGVIISFHSVVYMCNEPTSEMLKYNENQIANEFLSVLSEEEKKEFKNHDVDKLLEKYKSAIIGRTWMCREEHEFNIDYDNGSRIDVVTPIVRRVIELIKLN